MGSNDVDILLNVDIAAAQTFKDLTELKAKTAELREQQKQLNTTTAEGQAEFDRLNIQIKANNKTIQQHEKWILNAMTQQTAQKGSIKALRAELSNLVADYGAMSDAEQNSAKGQELLDKTTALNEKLKELESAYGDNRRKVGEYENAGKALGEQLGSLTAKLEQLAAQGMQNSDTYRELFEEAKRFKAIQDEVSQSIDNASKNTAGFNAILEGAQAVTAAYGTWQSVTALMGVENEELDKTMQKLVIVMGALESLTTLQALAQKQSNVYRMASNLLQKIGIKQTRTEVAAVTANAAAVAAVGTAENATTAAKIRGVVATKAATAAQWLWNAAMSANPVVLLTMAVLALIAGASALVGWLSSESEATRESKRAHEELTVVLEEEQRYREKLEKEIQNSIERRQVDARREILELKKKGASEAEILKARERADIELTDMKQKNASARIDSMKTELNQTEKTIKKMEKERAGLRVTSDRYKELTDKIKELKDARDGLYSSISAEEVLVASLEQDKTEIVYEAEKKRAELNKTGAENAARAAKERADAAIAEYEKRLDAQKRFKEASLKAEAGYQSDDLSVKQEYERKLFSLNQETEKAKLENLRKHKRITEDEYKQSLDLMQVQLTEFNNSQTKNLGSFFESERKAITGMLMQTLDEEIAGIEEKYTDAVKRLEAVKPPEKMEGESSEAYEKRLAEHEKFVLEQANIVIRLERQKNKQIEELRKNDLEARVKQIEDTTREAYADELLKYENNERAKLDITEKMLREQAAAKKAIGVATNEEEAELEKLALQRTALNLNRDLLLAGDNAKAKYEAKVKALNEEREIHADNADKQLEIDVRLAEAEQELIDARLEKFTEWRDAATGLMDSFSSLVSGGLDRELQKVQETYDKEAEFLADMYAQRVFTEAEYNRETLKLEKKKAKEEAKIERERAIRERASKVFSVVTDTAMGITKAVAASPLTGGLPWSAIVAATGALNLATILAEPLPKAARGGMISGPSHAQGGTIIEAEGGEAVMTRRAVSMFGPLLSAINVLGGGVPFAAPLSDGGYILRSHIQGGATAGEIAEALGRVQIVTLVEDINREQQKMAEIQSSGAV